MSDERKSLCEDARRAPTREEMATIGSLAEKFVAAHKSRNPSSKNATLGEEGALFNLRWQLNMLARECNGA